MLTKVVKWTGCEVLNKEKLSDASKCSIDAYAKETHGQSPLLQVYNRSAILQSKYKFHSHLLNLLSNGVRHVRAVGLVKIYAVPAG